MSDIYDAVATCAGPPGSAAAIALSRGGRQVLLLERRLFPRDKPCRDLIGARAMAADGGPFDLTSTSPLGRRLLANSEARVIPRVILEHRLVQAAVDAGVDFRQATVRDVGSWRGGVRLIRGEGFTGSLEVAARGRRRRVRLPGRATGSRRRLRTRDRDARLLPRRDLPRRSDRGFARSLGAPGVRMIFPLADGGAKRCRRCAGRGTLFLSEARAPGHSVSDRVAAVSLLMGFSSRARRRDSPAP